MHRKKFLDLLITGSLLSFTGTLIPGLRQETSNDNTPAISKYLFVAGERSLGGIKVLDIDDGHTPVDEIDYGGGDAKGITASAATGMLYLSSHWQDEVVCWNLTASKVEWRRSYGRYADRLSVTPDGELLYIPLRQDGEWVVSDASDGTEITRIQTPGRPHNTLAARGSNHIYLSALDNPFLYQVDRESQNIVKVIGPFSSGLRPFTVNADETLAFVNVDGLLGFEIGDIKSGRRLVQIGVGNYPEPEESYHNTPSHGIGLRPDGKEIWCVNAGGYLHVFDLTKSPIRQTHDIKVNGDPGWITFSIDGAYAYSATGDVIDTRKKEIVARIPPSEKMIEIDFRDGQVVRVGSQVGITRKV
ncbi:YncE family protein [Halalkalibaculum sp. DA3122]|uniref:YncE family protein n=1 Tax=Halalkalibaculum sp. DA3122 TaxID=3373607 RepID=UPI003754D136